MPRDLAMSEYREMADAYAAGEGLDVIGARFGRSRTAVKTACAMFGIPMKRRGAKRDDNEVRMQAIRDAIKAGMSKRAARKHFKVSDPLIQRALGEPERQRKELRKTDARARGLEVNQALRDEVEAAIARDRALQEEADRRHPDGGVMTRARSWETSNHRRAKARLARWLKKTFPDHRVATEYPLGYDCGEVCLWHDWACFESRTPGIRELRNMGVDARYRLDVCVVRPGEILYGFEVLHSCGPSDGKERFLNRMTFDTIELRAHWINAHAGKMPEAWREGVHHIYGPNPWCFHFGYLETPP